MPRRADLEIGPVVALAVAVALGWALTRGEAMDPNPYAAPSSSSRRKLYRTASEARAALGSLSRYHSWTDAFRRSRFTEGIPHDVAARMRVVAATYLDPIVADVGPIRVTSWYREGSEVSSGRPSAHATGDGVDFAPLSQSSPEYAKLAAEALLARRVPFDRLIWYEPEDGGHVHLGAIHPTYGTTEQTVRRKVPGADLYPVVERYA